MILDKLFALKLCFEANIGITLGRDLAVLTRSADNEPIWMKSGAL